jgi:dCMP deaminase
MSQKWDSHFLKMALLNSGMSKDASTKVGSIIVNEDRLILSAGFNGFPRGIWDDARLNDRDTKLKIIVHAEMNAILAAARIGVSVKGATMYTACQRPDGALWGGPPCTRCAVECIQAGIKEVVSLPAKTVPSRWHEDLNFALQIMCETGMSFREVESL